MKKLSFILGLSVGIVSTLFVVNGLYDPSKYDKIILDLAQYSYVTGCVAGSHLRNPEYKTMNECIQLSNVNRDLLKKVFDQFNEIQKRR